MHAEDHAAMQIPGGVMTKPFGWRRSKLTGELEWTEVRVCIRCRHYFQPEDLIYPGDRTPWHSMTTMNGIAELQLRRVDWGSFRQIDGRAAIIGSALAMLFGSTSATEAERAYWELENWIVAQGTVYSSAEPALSVLMASFLDNRILPIRVSALDLMYQILTGEADALSDEVGNGALMDRCRTRVREGLWLLVREAMTGLSEAALDVIEVVDEDRAARVRGWLATGR